MRKVNYTIVALALILTGGCNTYNTYNSIQRQHQQTCDRAPSDDARQQCEAESAPNYEDYERERERLLEGEE